MRAFPTSSLRANLLKQIGLLCGAVLFVCPPHDRVVTLASWYFSYLRGSDVRHSSQTPSYRALNHFVGSLRRIPVFAAWPDAFGGRRHIFRFVRNARDDVLCHRLSSSGTAVLSAHAARSRGRDDRMRAMSVHGTFRTSTITLTMSAHRVKPDIGAALAGRGKMV
jgi:hypothetical protein